MLKCMDISIMPCDWVSCVSTMAANCGVECAAWNWRTFNGNADVVSSIQCILLIVLSTSIDSYDADKVSTDSLLTVANSSCLW